MDEQADAMPDDTLDVVARYRVSVLMKAGFSELHAVTLAVHAGVDWHQAVEMLESGCPENQVVSILT